MKGRNLLLAAELTEFFSTSLGCRSQTYDNTGLNASPDPEAGITDATIKETTFHRRIRARLAKLDPAHYVIVARAYSIARPLPVPVLASWGGDEPVARVALSLDLGRTRAVALARQLLDEAVTAYGMVRRGESAPPSQVTIPDTGSTSRKLDGSRTWVPTSQGRGAFLSPRERERARLLGVLSLAPGEDDHAST